jgi:hypothetical protein
MASIKADVADAWSFSSCALAQFQDGSDQINHAIIFPSP